MAHGREAQVEAAYQELLEADKATNGVNMRGDEFIEHGVFVFKNDQGEWSRTGVFQGDLGEISQQTVLANMPQGTDITFIHTHPLGSSGLSIGDIGAGIQSRR